MSALNVQDIQRRVRSISSTKKLTNAMMLIATSNLRKYRLKMQESRIFYDTYLDLGNDIFSRYLENHEFITKNEVMALCKCTKNHAKYLLAEMIKNDTLPKEGKSVSVRYRKSV